MQMSKTGRIMLLELEGFKTRVYHDSAGLPTIGVGHLLTREELDSGQIWLTAQKRALVWRNGLSREDVEALLAQDLPEYEQVVKGLLNVSMEQHEFDALVSFCFNVGETRFSESTLLKRVNAGRFDVVPDEFRKWIFVTIGGVKKRVRGLVNRREQEIRCWSGDLLPAQKAAQVAPVDQAVDVLPISPQPLPQPRVVPRSYTPDRWLALVNPLDWFPRYGTYLSIFAALALFLIDAFAYPINDAAYAVLGAFATARMRRAIDRNPVTYPSGDYNEYASYR